MGSRGDDRRRYIVFLVGPGPVGRRAIEERLKADDALLGVAKVLDLDAGHGVLQVPHLLKERAIAAMRRAGPDAGGAWWMRPVGTSGTVRRARARFLPPVPPTAPPAAPPSKPPKGS